MQEIFPITQVLVMREVVIVIVSCIKSSWSRNTLSLRTSKVNMATTAPAHLPGKEKIIVLSQLMKQTLAKYSDIVTCADMTFTRDMIFRKC